ncbi:MAG: hypothetical protein MST03_09310 [Bacteroidales bacterium]|nr:hypothetical protein [Bacteroidales bacterium]
MSRKYIGYAGQIAIVFVSLYLLFTVGLDFYLYDVEYSGGSDDARWTIPNESWDYEDTLGLLVGILSVGHRSSSVPVFPSLE